MAFPRKLIGLGAGAVGSIWDRVSNDRIRKEELAARNRAAQQLWNYVQSHGLPPGTLWNQIVAPGLSGMFELGRGFEYGGGNPFGDLYWRTIGRYETALDDLWNYNQGIDQIPDYNDSPFIRDVLMPNIEGGLSRLNYGMDTLFDILNSQGWNPYHAAAINQAQAIFSGNDPYLQDISNVGGYLVRTGGENVYNRGLLDNALSIIRSGGYTPQIGSFIGRASGLGRDAYGRALGFLETDPSLGLGKSGLEAIMGLARSPYIQSTFGAAQGMLHDTGGILQALGSDFLRSGQRLEENRAVALGSLMGPDSLPAWFGHIAQAMPNAGALLSGAYVSGGGGGGGVASERISRDTGPVDPKMEEALERAYAAIRENPLLPMETAVSMARAQAALDARNQANALSRRLAGLGVQGPIAAGAYNSALADFADQELQEVGRATRQAALGQQQLALERERQMASLAQALQGLKQSREQMFMNANIADAENALRAAITNAQLSDSAASRSLQASIHNAQNQVALANLLSGNWRALLEAATGLRGQNIQSNLGMMGLLPALENARNPQFAALSDIYRIGPSALDVMSNIANSDIGRFKAIGELLSAGSSASTSKGGILAGLIPATLQAELGGINAATNNLNTMGNIANIGLDDQNKRMGLGLNMIDSALGKRLQAGQLGSGMINDMLRYGLEAGALGNSMMNTYGGLLNTASGAYNQWVRNTLDARDLGIRGRLGGINATVGMFNPIMSGAQFAMNPYVIAYTSGMDYAGRIPGLMSSYANLYTPGKAQRVSPNPLTWVGNKLSGG
ncbi:MAG: hypothetical protein V2G41_09665 [bacterium JZ-2024 1]